MKTRSAANSNSRASSAPTRRFPIGAEPGPDGVTDFRVWAPDHSRVRLVLESTEAESPTSASSMEREPQGYFRLITEAPAGTRYWFELTGGKRFPDPASRFQPAGPRGPSEVIDARTFHWSDDAWKGIRLAGQALYEIHVGTFTPEGTWRAAQTQLDRLAELGVTCLEILPIGDWSGDFGWGYDGVNLFAPTRLYGRPDDFRAFVNRAHELGLGVMLDVVYNHFGLHDSSVQQFSADYLSAAHKNDWGAAINYDGPQAEPVREFVLSNVSYWIDEFHLDGYRIDASQTIADDSPRPILGQIGPAARAAAGNRTILLIAENEPQDTRLARPLAGGGLGLDGLWNEDFHHAAMARLTGTNEAYYTDYRGTADEFVAMIKWGFLYQGQRYSWQNQRRGTPAFDLLPATFVNYLQNHDQVANAAGSRRISQLTSPGRLRAMTGLLLLMPQTPLLFQGQEFAASTPFCFFNDAPAGARAEIVAGRREFLSQFRSLATPEAQQLVADPADPETFRGCKLDFRERERHREIYDLHKDLLAVRRSDPFIAAQRREYFDAAALNREALVVRYFDPQDEDRLLVVNFDRELRYSPCPQPLLAPPVGREWRTVWSSEDPRYGGAGAAPLDTDEGWRIPAEAAVLLRAGVIGADAESHVAAAKNRNPRNAGSTP